MSLERISSELQPAASIGTLPASATATCRKQTAKAVAVRLQACAAADVLGAALTWRHGHLTARLGADRLHEDGRQLPTQLTELTLMNLRKQRWDSGQTRADDTRNTGRDDRKRVLIAHQGSNLSWTRSLCFLIHATLSDSFCTP